MFSNCDGVKLEMAGEQQICEVSLLLELQSRAERGTKSELEKGVEGECVCCTNSSTALTSPLNSVRTWVTTWLHGEACIF